MEERFVYKVVPKQSFPSEVAKKCVDTMIGHTQALDRMGRKQTEASCLYNNQPSRFSRVELENALKQQG
jgi:hypothetical protein